jgi:soluble lytic murein transglycosylase-like protein
MRNSLSYYLASAAVVLAVPSSPAFAHVHPHHGFYRHHRAYLAAAAQPNCGAFLGMQFPCPFGAAPAPQPSLQAPQQNSGFTSVGQRTAQVSSYSGVAATQAGGYGVPQSLIDRVIKRESGGNPRAASHGNYGLMQIRLSTARAMGYTGSAAGLLDPQTNMTYAVRYLAGAYRAAGGNESRAIALYSRGYYYQAKAQGFSP